MTEKKYRFLIYNFQIDDNCLKNLGIDAHATSCIGEANTASDEYCGLSDEKIIHKRVEQELRLIKGVPNPDGFYDHIENLEWREVWYDKEKDADVQIHHEYERRGYLALKNCNTNSNTEWFNTCNAHSKIFNECVDTIFGKIKVIPFEPRENQVRCIEKMHNAFMNGAHKFLIGAICRFGKTATLLHYFTSILPKKHILVISAKCDVQESWRKDYSKFVGNDKYDFLLKEDLKENSLPKDRSVIAMVSFQSAAKNYEETSDDYDNGNNEIHDSIIDDKNEEVKQWQKELAKYDWDVVIIDECHFGVDTSRSSNFLKKITKSNTLKVEVTATYQRKILRYEYDKTNAFIYDLQDEKLDYLSKNPGVNTSKIDYSKYVPVQFFHLNLYKAYENDKNVFGRNSKSLMEEQLKKFDLCLKDGMFSWDCYFDNDKGFSEGTIGMHFKSLYEKFYKKSGRNFAVYVNKVKHGNKLASAINLTNEFTVINLCGNNRESLGYVNRMLSDSEKSVVIVSCSRFLTGVTLEQLHGLIVMGTCNSVLNYIQYGLRGKNTYEGREYPCSIFDLNTYSFLCTDSFKEMVIAKARVTNKSHEEILKSEYNQYAFEIFEMNNGNVLEQVLDFDEALQKNWTLNEDGTGVSSLIIGETTITEDHFNDLINCGIDLIEFKLKEKKLEYTKKQCEKPSKKKNDVSKNSNNTDKDEDEKKVDYKLWLIKLTKIVNCIPLYVYLYNPSSLDEIIESKSEAFDDFAKNGIQILTMMKKVWNDRDEAVRWADLNDAIFKIAKNIAA